MALDTVQFVDSIASSPTVRLDLNTASGWRVKGFDPGVPGMRRAMSENAMRDGVFVSSSSYGARTVTLDLVRTSSGSDTNAGSIQSLMRELDRETNYLKYQEDGATKPVFFKVYRSSPSQLQNVWTSALAHHEVTVELLADPFALGLRETVSVGTVNNDPAAGSNGLYFDVTGVIGDVAAPLVMVDTATPENAALLAVRQHGTPTDLPVFVQAESMTLGTDTTNPGGAADAAMSGSGTTNYRRTSFATTTTMATRLTHAITTDATQAALRGMFRMLAVVRRSSGTGTLRAQVNYGRAKDSLHSNDAVTIPGVTARQMIDLGVVSFTSDLDTVYPLVYFELQAAQDSGSSTLDWDYIQLVPADESYLIYRVGTTFLSYDAVIDGNAESVCAVTTGTSIYTGTDEQTSALEVVGAFPVLVPNQTNRFIWVKYTPDTFGFPAIDKTVNSVVTLYYYPRYLFIRPSAS